MKWNLIKDKPFKKPKKPRDCYDPAKCRIKQVQARKLEAMGERRVHLKWCAVCDRGQETPKEEIMTETIIATGKPAGKKAGKCVTCGQEKSIAAQGMCWACYEKRKKGDQTVTKSADKPVPAPIEKTAEKSMLMVDVGRIPGLYEWLEKQAEEDLRGLAGQALWYLKRQMEAGK